MRIVSGTLRGKKLFSGKGLRLRPTSDRVRESIFDILQGIIAGGRVLDLFSGTGALGIEALSRGALAAVFVENHPGSLDALRKNLAACRLQGVSEILPRGVEPGLRFLESRGDKFEFIFLDPPYGKGLARSTVEKLAQSVVLQPESLIIAEHSPAEEIAEFPPLKRTDFRKYGSTRISFFRQAR